VNRELVYDFQLMSHSKAGTAELCFVHARDE